MPTDTLGSWPTVAALGALLGLALLGGCKNPCEKAIDHMRGCLGDYCEGNAESRVCQRLDQTGMETSECTAQAIVQAEAMLAQDCEMLTGTFTTYMRGAQASEAALNVRNLATSARYYYEIERVSPTGDFLPFQFPRSAPLTPRTLPCGSRAIGNAADWQQPTWEALNFSIAGEHYFAYQFDARGDGPNANFTATAFGDLDCDGQLSTFQRSGRVVDNEVEVGELQTYNEGE